MGFGVSRAGLNDGRGGGNGDFPGYGGVFWRGLGIGKIRGVLGNFFPEFSGIFFEIYFPVFFFAENFPEFFSEIFVKVFPAKNFLEFSVRHFF